MAQKPGVTVTRLPLCRPSSPLAGPAVSTTAAPVSSTSVSWDGGSPTLGKPLPFAGERPLGLQENPFLFLPSFLRGGTADVPESRRAGDLCLWGSELTFETSVWPWISID